MSRTMESFDRIVSLVPSTTETLFALGLGDRVVGVTDYCIRPSTIPLRVRRVGGSKQPNLVAIRDLNPDLILCNQEENRREDVEFLSRIARVEVCFPRTVAEAVEDLRKLARLLDVEITAEEIVKKIEIGAERIRGVARHYRFAYLIWRRPWMVAGKQTFIDELISLGGGQNIFRQPRYPEVTLKELRRGKPDAVFLPDEPYPFREKHREEIVSELGEEWRTRCLLVPGDNYCWHGVRLVEGLKYYLDWLRGRNMGGSEKTHLDRQGI